MRRPSTLFVCLFACLISFKASAATIIVGDCNTVVNLNFQDRESVLSVIKAEYPSADLTSIELIVEIAGCHEKITDPKRKAELLIFALNELIIIKEETFLPAIDNYIKDPTEENFRQMLTVSQKAVRKIDSAIDTLVSYQAAIATADDLSPGRPAVKDEERLATIHEQLQQKLKLQLDGPLKVARKPPASMTVEAMKSYRAAYARILIDIKTTIEQMIDQLRQSAL